MLHKCPVSNERNHGTKVNRRDNSRERPSVTTAAPAYIRGLPTIRRMNGTGKARAGRAAGVAVVHDRDCRRIAGFTVDQLRAGAFPGFGFGDRTPRGPASGLGPG